MKREQVARMELAESGVEQVARMELAESGVECPGFRKLHPGYVFRDIETPRA